MQVRALQMGFYMGIRRRPGTEFTLADPKHFSKKWMEKVTGVPEKKTAQQPKSLKEVSDANEKADKKAGKGE